MNNAAATALGQASRGARRGWGSADMKVNAAATETSLSPHARESERNNGKDVNRGDE